MQRRHIFGFIAGLALALLLAIGFRIGFPPATSTPSGTILVSAAASLQDALEAIKPLFEQADRSVAVNYNFGSSGQLQQQIEQGAPADLFISAASRQMDALEAAGLLLAGTRRDLLTNSLVLIVPQNSTSGLTEFQQLINNNVRRISVGELRSVPAGQYAEQVLDNLGILAQVRSKLVFANNVRAVLAAVESGNVDAGVVYRTDALLSDQITQVATASASLHDPIVYPMAILKESGNVNAARAFEQFLMTSQASRVFESYGFGITP